MGIENEDIGCIVWCVRPRYRSPFVVVVVVVTMEEDGAEVVVKEGDFEDKEGIDG